MLFVADTHNQQLYTIAWRRLWTHVVAHPSHGVHWFLFPISSALSTRQSVRPGLARRLAQLGALHHLAPMRTANLAKEVSFRNSPVVLKVGIYEYRRDPIKSGGGTQSFCNTPCGLYGSNKFLTCCGGLYLRWIQLAPPWQFLNFHLKHPQIVNIEILKLWVSPLLLLRSSLYSVDQKLTFALENENHIFTGISQKIEEWLTISPIMVSS